MGLTGFSEGKIQSGATCVDNFFFKNHLKQLPENCLKVYLYGLYVAANRLEEENSVSAFAESLGLSEQEISDAFAYLDGETLVEIVSRQPLEIKFPDLKSGAARSKKIKPEKYSDFSLQVQSVLKERMITPNEFNEYFLFIEENRIEPAALVMIIKYCTQLRGNNVSYRYILTVAADWVGKGLDSVRSVTQEITDRERLKNDVERILAALKIKRVVENEDNDLFLKWTKEFGFDTQNILYAASLLRDKKGGMNRLDSFLLKLYNNKAFSAQEIKAYSDNLDMLKELTQKVLGELGLWFDRIDPVITHFTQPWLNLGFSGESILFIASYCTRKNRRTLEDMNEQLNGLYNQGIVSYEAISRHIVNIAERDKKLKEILNESGLYCAVNKWHRENYSKWCEWGFSDELITYAASISCGKVNPIPYINSVLSNWKSKGVATVEQAKNESAFQTAANQKSTYMNNRSYSDEELNKLIDDISDLDI